MKKTFEVRLSYSATYVQKIEAESQAEAEKMAEVIADRFPEHVDPGGFQFDDVTINSVRPTEG